MKLHEIIRFKNRIEKRKSYFDLPDLPEKEWNYLLQRARAINVKDIGNENSISDKLYSFMCSRRLSFVLSIAIIMVLALSLLFSANINESSNKNNTASNNRVNVPVVNVSNNSFI